MKLLPKIMLSTVLPFSSGLRAMPLNFTFSFYDIVNNTDVTGIVRGLLDDTSDQMASSVEALTSSGGFGEGEYVGNPRHNSWAVEAGLISEYRFLSFGALNTPSDVTCCSLSFTNMDGPWPFRGLTRNRAINQGSFFPVTFAPVSAQSVSGPATLALFPLGLAGLCLARRRTV